MSLEGNMPDKTINGSCLCGQVSYQLEGPSRVFQHCHCSRCRKFTGSAYASNFIVEPTRFQWIRGKEMVGRYELPDTKHFATSFCKNCGSSLPWKTKTALSVVIPAGTLDTNPEEKPTHSIFYADRASWYQNLHTLPKYDKFPIKS